MANKMRWRYGETNRLAARVDADTSIEIGDLLWYPRVIRVCDLPEPPIGVKPASDLGRFAQPLAAQLEFAAMFAGVAMQLSRPGDTEEIRVATTGVFEFDCEHNVYWVPGDKVAVSVGVDHRPRRQVVAHVVRRALPLSIGAVARRTLGKALALVEIDPKLRGGE